MLWQFEQSCFNSVLHFHSGAIRLKGSFSSIRGIQKVKMSRVFVLTCSGLNKVLCRAVCSCRLQLLNPADTESYMWFITVQRGRRHYSLYHDYTEKTQYFRLELTGGCEIIGIIHITAWSDLNHIYTTINISKSTPQGENSVVKCGSFLPVNRKPQSVPVHQKQ